MNPKLEFTRRSNLKKSIQDSRQQKHPIELIVKSDFSRRDGALKHIRRVGEISHVYDSIPFFSFKCEPEDAYRLSQTFYQLAEHKAFRSVAASLSAIDVSSTIRIPPVSKSKSAGLWNLEDIGAYAAREVALGNGARVAIVDTGVDYRHPEVSGNFGSKKGYDFVRSTADPMDFNGHGTHVAGIAFGQNYGVAGGAAAYAVRVLDSDGSGSEADTIAGLDWAAGNGVDVVNLSLGAPFASAALEEMCYYLANKGVVLVAAAGNSGFGPNYPAAFGDPVIAVAAVDRSLNHPEFSNIYDTNDISAPGVGITSSYIGGYATLSGTSMAAPHVSGSMALVLSALRKETDLEQLMEDTAQKLSNGFFPERDVYGAGLLRVDKMAQAVSQMRNFRDYGAEALAALKEALWT